MVTATVYGGLFDQSHLCVLLLRVSANNERNKDLHGHCR